MPLRLQKRFLDSDGGKAEQCELIMSMLEVDLKSTVMSEFDAARLKAERKTWLAAQTPQDIW